MTTLRSRLFGRSTLVPVKVPAFKILDAVQGAYEDPSVQLDALALVFTLLGQSAGIDPHELVTRAKRQLIDADAVRNPHLEAIRDYAAGELSWTN